MAAFKLLKDEDATEAAAKQLATTIEAGATIALYGELGAGKTLFSRALMRQLGVKDEVIPSPTYAIIQPYQGDHFPIAHMDWYRMEDAESLFNIGIEAYLQPPWVSIIEWSQRASELLPASAYHITLTMVADNPAARQLQITHPSLPLR
ncbi:MAG: tRNA (adenosine(37)-N6)-threonylcarbamoyltransferase complex ATPase subunit type 1 TsaE [Mariprofundales bacterium]